MAGLAIEHPEYQPGSGWVVAPGLAGGSKCRPALNRRAGALARAGPRARFAGTPARLVVRSAKCRTMRPS